MLDYNMTINPPSQECNTTFTKIVVDNMTVQLQWDPVNTSTPECFNSFQYNVSYRCCSGSSWKQTKFTSKTSIEFQANSEGSEIDERAVFSVQVEGSNYISNLTVNLASSTGMRML